MFLLVGIVLGAILSSISKALWKHSQGLLARSLTKVELSLGRWFLYNRWEREYRRTILEEHRYLKFVGVSQPVSLHRPKLRDVFVNLELRTTVRAGYSAEKKTLGLGETYTLESALERFKRFVLLGPPGAGKTTLLEHLTCIFCRGSAFAGKYLPIFIPLRRCSFEGASLIEQLTDPKTGLLPPALLRHYPKGFFENRLSQGQCILLFDGLDEVLSDEEHVAAARMVETTSVAFVSCSVLVTSRLAGWRNLLGASFIRFSIRELSPRDIQGLIRQWNRAVVREEIRAATLAPLTKDQEEHAAQVADEKSREMIDLIRATPRLHEIAATPLILSLMCLVYYTQRNLPRHRAQLYEECVVILLDEWDRKEKQLLHPGIPALEKKLEMVEQIAFHFFEVAVTELRRRDLLTVITKILESQSSELSGVEALRFIEERSGLISEKARDRFSFTHLTLQEYFAASALAHREDGISRLLERYQNTDAEEIVLLYAGLVSSADEVVSRLLALYKSTGEIRALVTAGRAAFEGQVLGVQAKKRIVSALNIAFDNAETGKILEDIQSVLRSLGVERAIVRKFGEFDLGDEIGRGGFGTVYSATLRSTGEKVALKVFNALSRRSAEVVRSALPGLKELRHPNLVQIRDYGEHEEQFFITMKFVEGLSVQYLADHSPGFPIPLTIQGANAKFKRFYSMDGLTIGDWNSESYIHWTARIMNDCSKALAYIHAIGTMHHDVKPANITWTGDKAVLLDLGLDLLIAKNSRGPTFSSTGFYTEISIRTPVYSAPEVEEGGKLDSRVDIYGLGATVYFLLTGQYISERIYRPTKSRKIPDEIGREGIPKALSDLVLEMVAKEPMNRPQSFDQVIAKLQPILESMKA